MLILIEKYSQLKMFSWNQLFIILLNNSWTTNSIFTWDNYGLTNFPEQSCFKQPASLHRIDFLVATVTKWFCICTLVCVFRMAGLHGQRRVKNVFGHVFTVNYDLPQVAVIHLSKSKMHRVFVPISLLIFYRISN